ETTASESESPKATEVQTTDEEQSEEPTDDVTVAAVEPTSSEATKKATPEAAKNETVAPAPTTTPAPAPTEAPASGLSVSQQNAVRSAESYLRFTAFSRQGLIDQLEYEGYSTS